MDDADRIRGKILTAFESADRPVVLVRLTEKAGTKLSSLLTRQGRPQGALRVAVIGGGCSGLQYKMDLQDAPANRDHQA